MASHTYTNKRVGMRTLRPLKITFLFICVFGLPILAFWMGGRFFELKNVSKDYLSQSRFSQIRRALLAYHDQHGVFPPTKFKTGPNGPVHSWRVLLVPYTDADYRKRYSEYDFSKEWNSANNLHAVGNMPYFYYFNMNANNGITNYFAVGDGEDWPSKKPLKSWLVTRGKDRFFVVEYPDSDVLWMEPKY